MKQYTEAQSEAISQNGHSAEAVPEFFAKRGISEEVFRERGYTRVEDAYEFHFDYGFPPFQWAGPGWMIPVYPPGFTEPSHWVYRSDNPNGGPKYLSAKGQPMRLDVPPRCQKDLRDINVALIVTEGMPKADSAASKGFCAVALMGVDSFGWKTEPGLPIKGDLEIPLNGRQVWLGFDSDCQRNPNVFRALMRLTRFLRERGAIVRWIRLPDAEDGSKQGLDDWFAAGHSREELEALIEEPAIDLLIGAPLDDAGNAERFASENWDQARFCLEEELWYCWDGRKWDRSNQERVKQLAIETGRETQLAAAKLPSSNQDRDKIVKHAANMGNRSAIAGMIDLAKPALASSRTKFDTDLWLLNCPNGTIDLRTGALRPHDPADLLTKMADVPYDPEARDEGWDSFLAKATDGKEGLADFLQRAAGYSCTGDTREDRLFMILGSTRTGKTTFVEAIRAALGGYAATANFDTFVQRKSDGGPREDIARLADRRFVEAVEAEEGKSLADALIKQLTGGDTIAARFLYQATVEFKPQPKLWLVANHEPIVSANNEAMWERILRIPFDNYIPLEERDRELKARLKDPTKAGPAVLAWLVEGALKWQAEGLNVPECVTASTAAYRQHMDPLEGFLDDECYLAEEARFPSAEIFPAYSHWAKRNNVRESLGRTKFIAALRAKGFEQKQPGGKGARFWAGLGPIPIGGSSFE